MKPIVIDHILSESSFLHLNYELIHGWNLSQYPGGEKTPSAIPFWQKPDAMYTKFFHMLAHDVILKIKRYFPHNHLTFTGRIHTNSQSFGQESIFHQDYSEPNYIGLNICTEPIWNMEWGGSFDVYTDGWNIESVPYIPNRGIIFDPTQRHKGMSPTRYCLGRRTTVVFFYELSPRSTNDQS